LKEISLHILDIVQNSISAQATLICVYLEVDRQADTLSIRIDDNGRGMDEEMLSRVQSPFTTTRTTRRVGLGIPLFAAGAQGTDGTFSIWSKPGEGTRIKAVYTLNHIDRPPIGDFAGTMHTLIVCNPTLDFVVGVSIDGQGDTLDTREVRKVLGGDVPLDSPDVSIWLSESMQELFPPEYAAL